MISMKHNLLYLIIVLFSSSLMAKTMCSISIQDASGPFKDNATLNDGLKKHQKLKRISFSLDLNDLKNKENNKVQLIFETVQSKKFEMTYSAYNKNMNVWKVDFSTSQIFPQLFKSYMNITLYNSKYYLRLYDNPTEKTIVNLIFESSHCSPSNKPTVLTRISSY